MSDLVIYGAPLSPFVRKVEVALTEKRLDYELESVNICAFAECLARVLPEKADLS